MRTEIRPNTHTRTGRRSERFLLVAIPLILALGLTVAASAGQIALPFNFVDGTVAYASQVNANFNALKNESNAQDLRIAALEGGYDLQFATSQSLASPGNSGRAAIMIAVNSGAGPVNGLTLSNFSLVTRTVPAGGSSTTVDYFFSEPEPGVYMIKVVPFGTGTWKEGRYLFSLQLTIGTDRVVKVGQIDIAP